ncbi:hypothetical protein A2865_03805 [Candidatus Woesebacteria bacterium RIFCSPHIGHO2_01_FULL_39_17]|uniref:FemAB family protein n=2 Tax=Candidatus Woeseibacteriota TaxID=1752722 RepID=A0A0G0RKG8_9BACT|nr:MAG: femAB family protein [Microgenomates group bacterium GW2011_GWC1_38_12]KKR14107.1 MAG: FemAB family protein [Candidatus Woesebacteria bacterium GW2011_GWA1_39_21b]OGM23552.1 MAG: hypothetical protein A2865_03805 [Candidatus Woesebacteria bacterium RIFCSPHIGHO2_01_FULL_39_17]OGM62997.1 MAG: hypothetical protein A3A52_03330 [Candidatus Woesebacteria bacterium RIFCSPLOWO2_01_FULL_39_14]
MVVKQVTEKNKKSFNEVAVHPLQTWEWGEFREKAGNKVVRLGVFDGYKLTDAVQVIFSKIPHTNYKIGTVIKGQKPTVEIIKELKKLGNEERAIFIKLEPNVPFSDSSSQQVPSSKEKDKLIKTLKQNGAVSGKTLFTPTTFWIDLSRQEDDILKSFNSKTRYNIRVAQKHGVEVVEDNSDKAFERYIELTRETVERQGFYSHTEKYHRLMWQHLHKDMVNQNKFPIAHLLNAIYQNEIITTWIVFVYKDFLYYPYGASSEKYKNVMANNLMMWEAIRFGKKLGLKTFDLWGREEGKGFTKFKEGYNSQVVEFLGTWDLVTSLLYWPYRAAESLRWQILRTKSKFVKPSF